MMSEEGSDDSPPRPKRKIKKVTVVSSSDSDSDHSVGMAGPSRKRLRVISDEEASDSSGSSVIRAGTRRSRTLPKLRDSDDESGSEEEASDSSGSSVIRAGTRRSRTLPKLRDSNDESDSSGWTTDVEAKPVTSASKPASGFASDSSEGNSDKCSICLLRFKEQEVGIPENCEHVFCLDCITEWSKNVNTCPVDRMTFNSIVVRACLGGRVLRTEPVKVLERRSSDVLLEFIELTACQICGGTDDEHNMLLCDGCDLGYHMQCLSPPLSEVPQNQWFCPSCQSSQNSDVDILGDINLSEVEDLFDGINGIDLPLGPRSVPLRQQRNVRRSNRNVSRSDQPSTSSGRRSNSININELPTSSRSSRVTQSSTNRRQAVTKRRKYKRRRTKTVIVEYEVQENGKFPITKRVKKKVKKRRVKKRQPRTAARRSYVRASVRAKLATLKADQRIDIGQVSNASGGVIELSIRRHRAGIPSLSILGNPYQLEYFSDDNDAISEEASTAVATRSTSNILSAYRQARRKMVTVPSPPHASSAPDILSNILESQTLLHSKNSIISVSVDGNIDYKIQKQKQNQQKKNDVDSKNEEKIDLSKANETVRKVPSYPGQNRGGGWGGGYRGNYHREQNSNNFNRGGNYENNYGGGYQNRQGNSYSMRREDTDYYDSFPRRQQQFPHTDDTYFDRSRRPVDNNRGTNYSNHQRPNDQNQGRYSLGPSWQPYGGGGPPAHTPRHDMPPVQSRHSFGGFENPVDMRMGQISTTNTNMSSDTFPGMEAPRQEKAQPQAYQPPLEPHPYRPLTEAPVFNFQKNSEVEKSEDERSDSGLVIDTEKYDPTEPTHDDDSGDEDKAILSAAARTPIPSTVGPTSAAPPTPPAPPALPPPPAMHSILAGLDTSAMNVPPNILDTAVRQVLKEHRNLIVPSNAECRNDRSDDDSDGDCPNFSIYSATSVHIANNTNSLPDEVPKEQPQDSLEDLVQEDDETPPSTSPVAMLDAAIIEKKYDISRTTSKPLFSNYDTDDKKKSEEEYKEKVSKRCPITTNTRNPIKIKLNTPSLIKRQVSLYDEEESAQEIAIDEKTESTTEITEETLNCNNTIMSPKKSQETPEKSDYQVESKESKWEKAASLSPVLKGVVDSEDTSEKPEIIQNETTDCIVNENKEDLCQNETSDKCENLNSKKYFDTSEEKIEDAAEKKEESVYEDNSDEEIDVPRSISVHSPSNELKGDDNVEKMTESISETEDERSYTPCLDENKSNKDASFETEKDKGLEGLDTEMISEDEGNEMFSENERAPSEASRVSPPRVPVESEEGEIADKKKEAKKTITRDDGAKKKKKKDSKKDTKEKSKSKKKSEISFKKLSKSGKERNYRERDKNERRSERDRRDSGDANESRQRRRKEKRKDLERYDVRTVVSEKRRKQKDAFGRDVSPRGRSPSLSPPARSPSPARRSPSRLRRSTPRRRRSRSRIQRSPSRIRRSLSKGRRSVSRSRRSVSRARRSPSRIRRSPSPLRRSLSRSRRSPPGRKSISRRVSPVRGRSPSRTRASPTRLRRSASSPRRRSGTPRASPRRRPSAPRRKRRRSGSRVARRRSAGGSPPRRVNKKKKRARSARRAPDASPERKRRCSASRQVEPEPPSPMSRPPSPRTPPPEPEPEPRPPIRSDDELDRRERRRRDPDRPRRRPRDAVGPSKEVFTSGDNILVSVSFKEQERGEEGDRRRRRESRRDRRRRRRAAAAPDAEVVKPVAIIDLDRSPFRELTPSPKNVIVLSDSDHGEREAGEPSAPQPAAPEPAPEPAPASLGPKTPPSPSAPEPAEAAPAEGPAEEADAADSSAHSPDAYDPFEPTRSPSASPAAAPAAAPSPPPALITLEAAQRSNLSADEVLDRRPLTPVEKVLALLQSTRDASPEAAEEAPAPAPRIVLPSPTRAPAKLFPGKPSPIKSNPVKPMQALRPRAPSEGGASPYSPGSSDFGELFEPPPRRRAPAKVPVRLDRKRGKTQVGVKIDEENLKILDDLPSSAVEMQVKSKFLKKLNRQERVVEEVKLVLKPHYNKKRVTKDEYKDILRRAVPKICHNKSGEINPTKIQALVEAYVKKFRKKHKIGAS